ncbi:hypothetical protein ACLB2K_072228 [Fragaria x ananassa]
MASSSTSLSSSFSLSSPTPPPKLSPEPPRFSPIHFLKYQTMLTVFAPVDQVMVNHRIGELSEYSSVLRRHVVPCRLSWSDLKSLEDGSLLRTDLQGFVINVSRYDGVLELNGVSRLIDSPTEPNPVVPSPPHESQGSSGNMLRSGEEDGAGRVEEVVVKARVWEVLEEEVKVALLGFDHLILI